MKIFGYCFFILGLYSSFAFAEDKNIAHHPIPKEPSYLDAALYSELKTQLPKPPPLKSQAQLADEIKLREFQKSRSPSDCEQAKTEVLVSLKNFYGEPRGTLKDQEVEKLAKFFDQIRNDGDYFIQKMKKDFPRQRPFAYIKGINPCVPKEVTGAYPSGHATLSKLYASILSDFFPADKDKFEARSLEIAKHRILSGMHHPNDIESGRKLAEVIYDELKKSKNYQLAFQEMKTKLESK